MDRIQSVLHGRWVIPVVSGLLILASFAVAQILEEPFWGDVLMIAAAVVAGTPVVIKAVNALLIKVIGIDLLVSVAAIGAILVQNYWELSLIHI